MLGRKIIYTDVPEVTRDNLISILQKTLSTHQQNANECEGLLNYADGKQESIREKVTRKEIDHWVSDNLCGYIAEFKQGFEWGNPITLIQSDDDDVEDNEELTKAISLINQGYRSQGIKKKTQELARYVEVCGLGYTFVDVNTEYEEGDSYFTLNVLSPMTTYVVRSKAYVDKRIILAVTFIKYKETDGSIIQRFTCFTKDSRYEVLNKNGIYVHLDRSGEMNPLGAIPIIEWIRDFNRQGCFEKVMPMQDGLNLSVSDFMNDTDQNTNCIWHANDVEFQKTIVKTENEKGEEVETEVTQAPVNGEWVLTQTTAEGKTPAIKALTLPYDYVGMLQHIVSMRDEMLRLTHVPQRNDTSGGSSGIAMSDASGWTDAEAEASRKEMIMDSQKMEEVKVVLKAIKWSQDVPSDSPLLKIHYSDIAPNFKRSKTYDLTNKVNAMCTALAHGFSLEDLVANIPLFEDSSQVVARSGEGVRKYQESVFDKDNEADGAEGEPAVNRGRLTQDFSDEVDKSPSLDAQ